MTVLPPQERRPALAGRRSELDRAASALTRGLGVALVGAPGVGRTSMAREVVTRLNADRVRVVWLTATETGRQVPFGALATLIPAPTPSVEVTTVVPAVREALRVRAGGQRLVLVVDDAHLLDGPSAAVLPALTDQVTFVVTVCAGAPAPDAVTTLWKDRYLERIAVEPLGCAETAQLVGALVGGEVAGPTAGVLHQWTRGNARYLTELVRAGLADGTLAERSGLWWWQAPLTVPPTLADLLDRQLDHLAPAAWQACGAVALGEPLPVEVLERIVGADVVVALEDQDLLRADSDQAGRLLLRFAHPLLGAAVRRRLSPARQRRTAAALLAAQPDRPTQSPEIVRTVLWQLDAGGPVDEGLLLQAADLTLHCDPALSLRLSQEAVRRRPSAAAWVARASALVELGRPDEARTVLEQAASGSLDTSADETMVALALAGHRAWADRDPAGAHAELTALLDRTDDPAGRAEIRSMVALVLLFGSQARDALAAAELVLADPAAERRSRLRAGLARAAALSLVGRTAEGLSAAGATAAECRDDPAGLPYVQGMALAAAGLAQIWREPVQQVPGTHPQTGRWPTSIERDLAGLEATAWPLFDGYVRRVAGDLPGAIRCLRTALVQQSGGEGLFRSEAAAWLVLCLADAGRTAEAEQVLRATPPDAMAVVPGLGLWARASVAAARGNRHRAIGLMLAAGATAYWAGCPLVEIGYLIYEAGIRGARGPAEVADRLRPLVDRVDAPRLVAMARATLAAADSGEPAPRAVTAPATFAEGPAPLTARERQIAALAADHLTDREIAERLVLSVRTVESHLTRAYRKLAVTSRRQLKRALHG